MRKYRKHIPKVPFKSIKISYMYVHTEGRGYMYVFQEKGVGSNNQDYSINRIHKCIETDFDLMLIVLVRSNETKYIVK